MEPDKVEIALTEMEVRLAELENATALLAYRVECELEKARKWDAPDLFTKEGE